MAPVQTADGGAVRGFCGGNLGGLPFQSQGGSRKICEGSASYRGFFGYSLPKGAEIYGPGAGGANGSAADST